MWYITGLPDRPMPPSRSTSCSSSKISGRPRAHHLDTLRSFLTTLVIVHHIAIVYGGEGAWYYVESPRKHPFLALFVALNQSFFMGAFFVLSGYFARASLSRPGCTPSKFWRGRLLRLGLPCAVYSLGGHALTLAFAQGNFLHPNFAQYLRDWARKPGVRGPPWYLALTLIFDGLLALAPHATAPLPRWAPPAALAGTMVWSWAIKAISPLGRHWPPLGLQAAFLPQYVLAYAVGILLHARPDLLDLLAQPSHAPAGKSKPTLASRAWHTPLPALGLFAGYSLLVLKLPPTRMLLRDSRPVYVPLSTPSALYCIWNELGFAVLTHAALWTAQRWGCKSPAPGYGVWASDGTSQPLHADGAAVHEKAAQATTTTQASGTLAPTQNEPARGMCRYAYAAFLIHPLFATAVPRALRSWDPSIPTIFTLHIPMISAVRDTMRFAMPTLHTFHYEMQLRFGGVSAFAAPLVKTVVVGALTVGASYSAAWLMVRTPVLRRVL